jgi:Flp pilus assembly protein TadD
MKYFLLAMLGVLLAGTTVHAQLPAGTTDTTVQPQATPQDPLRAEASAALNKQDYATAARLLATLAAKNPNDAHLLYDLGFSQDALDQTAAAEVSYRRAIAADASYFDPHLALGLLLARTGKHDLARAELVTATGLTTDNQALKARAYRALARLDQASKPAVASDELLSAMKISPETPDDILLSGELAEASGDAAAAEAAYRRLLATNPQNHDATAALTHLLIQQHKPDQAESLLTGALTKDPENPTLNAQLASVYDEEGKTAQAIPLVEKLHTAHPEDPDITRLLARLYSSSQQYDKAAPFYAMLLASSPYDPTLLDDSGDAQIHLHNFAEAESLLKRAVAQPADFPNKESLGEAASHLAFAASANNDPETTLQALEIRATVLANSPSSLFLAATAHDKLHHKKQAADLYKQFLNVANGKFPDEEWEARHRLITLDHMR